MKTVVRREPSAMQSATDGHRWDFYRQGDPKTKGYNQIINNSQQIVLKPRD